MKPEFVWDVWLARAAGSTRCAETSEEVIPRICSCVRGFPKIAWRTRVQKAGRSFADSEVMARSLHTVATNERRTPRARNHESLRNPQAFGVLSQHSVRPKGLEPLTF